MNASYAAAWPEPIADPARGSDPYPVTSWEDSRIKESSGLGVSPDTGLLFTMGDAGDESVVYAVDDLGSTRYRVALPEGSNVDWEDLAVVAAPDGGAWVYVADTGDAYFATKGAGGASKRTRFRLFRFREPPPGTTGTVPAAELATWDLEYPDDRTHNSEAMLVAPDQNVYLVEKSQNDDEDAYVWTVADGLKEGSVNVLTAVAEVPVTLATGGAWSPSGDMIAVRNRDTAYIWTVGGENLPAALSAPPIAVPLPEQRQGEAVAFDLDGRALLLSSEGRRSSIWVVPLPDDVTKPGAAEPASALTPQAEPDESARIPVAALLALAAVVVAASVGAVLTIRSRRTAARHQLS